MRVRIDLDLGGVLSCIGAMLYVLVTGIVLFSAVLLMADGVRFSLPTILMLSLLGTLVVPAVRYIVRFNRYGS